MSKLLAMMMKPKEYMYAMIKGSLTENPSGVFSGFSTDNYLKSSIPNGTDTNVEICLKFNATNYSTNSYILSWRSNNTNKGIRLNANGTISVYYSTLGASGTQLELAGNYIFQPNTNYWIKIIKIKNSDLSATLYLYYSLDGINYILDNQTSNDNAGNNTLGYSFVFGVNTSNPPTTIFDGSIDLNQSYIKINNTKYQLQAVVGYTVVGNPTITDGVVSGFTSSDYLSLPSLNFNSNNTEIVIKFTTGATISNQLILNVGSNQLYISSSSHLTFKISYDGNKWLTGTSLIQPNTTYYAKFINTSDGCSLYLSTDNINWNLDGKTTNFHITSNNIVYIGSGNTSYTSWSGSIYLNETYVKVNNKLWFNGQPA